MKCLEIGRKVGREGRREREKCGVRGEVCGLIVTDGIDDVRSVPF